MRPTLTRPSNIGRGRGQKGTGRGTVLAQMGNKRLIADKIADTAETSGNTQKQITFADYLAFIEAQKKGNNMPPSYSSALVIDDNEDIDSYEENTQRELIILAENDDLQWKDDP